ncbi:c6 zinc finger domain-containing protein [Fusarium sporotrichioides]|uniref:C6 zinc finger domain-containing protein n=1 Tax=Fusarium sporotrichioides TaxID=5514 RepID=A0A395RRC6_FUSSP|nr:c6 zinc finger domain-containing protein [Fusarium sporotrichioides]
MSTKIPKACEPCRLRKKRCSGTHPCDHPDCQDSPSTCVYRNKTRNRRSKRDSSHPLSQLPFPESGQSVDGTSPLSLSSRQNAETGPDSGVQQEVYHSVTETHLSPTSTDSSQLYYGPSSYFAFLQQIHRGVLPLISHGQSDGSEAQSGLDTFMQRSIFFGTASRISPEALRSENIQLAPVSREMAHEFLELFKATSYHRLPFYTTKASFLAMLAIGALATPQTDLAETLFTEARREAVILDDAVTLKTLQLSLLFADYQINMGRPNSTYLHLGVACRRAFALGLHLGALSTRLDSLTLKNHQTTIWSLYFFETYQSLSLGRRSGLKLKDIACPFPTEPLPTVRQCRIAIIMEDAAEAIYGRKSTSIRQLYAVAEELRSRLHQFAQDCGIGSATTQESLEIHESITLHNRMWNRNLYFTKKLTISGVYYHAIILIFRPFLVANQAMRVTGGASEIKDMWLRQACRHAIDASHDSIDFFSNISQTCRPSKYSYNMEYIQKALQALSSMVADEPVTSSLNSIRRVLETIETSITGRIGGRQAMMVDSATMSPHQHSRIQFPSVDQLGTNESGRMILLSEGNGTEDNRSNPIAPGFPDTVIDQDWTNSAHFNLNVMTTDLFNFFPLDMTTPLNHAVGDSVQMP